MQDDEQAVVRSSSGSSTACTALAADIGSLYRVIESRLDGSVLGVWHEIRSNGVARGGEVGGCMWEHDHTNDCVFLRASVMHAKSILQVLKGDSIVFLYW